MQLFFVQGPFLPFDWEKIERFFLQNGQDEEEINNRLRRNSIKTTSDMLHHITHWACPDFCDYCFNLRVCHTKDNSVEVDEAV